MLVSSQYLPAPLNALSLEWKRALFPVKTPEGERYMNIAPLLNRERTGYLQRLVEFDHTTMQSAVPLIEQMRKDGFNQKKVSEFQKKLQARIKELYDAGEGKTRQ